MLSCHAGGILRVGVGESLSALRGDIMNTQGQD